MNRIEILETIARKAGEFIRKSADIGQTNKSNAKDFVTVADIKARNIVADELGKHFPDEIVLSEEHSEAMREKMYASDFTGFVLDPIDGTYNFKRDMRESALSIGHVTNGEPDYGVIYDPYKDELYTVEKGKDAYRNGVAIHVNDQRDLEVASIATSNSYDDEAMARNVRRHLGIYEQTGIMPWTSCLGSGVLIMSWIACGRIDAYHHNGLKSWDNAVAFLLIREAGGVVHDLQGHDAPFTSATILAGNPIIVERLEKIFAQLKSELLK